MNKKRICVIGGGPSGLVTVKELSKYDFDIVCYEARKEYGGVFKNIREGGQSYDSLLLTVSNYFMAFSDFLPEQEERRYWTADEYRAYLKKYIDHFEISKYIQYSSEVIGVEDVNGKETAVTIFQHGIKKTEHFDHVIICSGVNKDPFIPQIKGLQDFKGEVVHSSNYENADYFKGKKVVCVGIGESGADIVHEISEVTECEVVVRDYPNVVPRWINGFTNDSFTSTCYYTLGKKGIDAFMKTKAQYYLKNKSADKSEILIQTWISERDSFIGKFLTKSDRFIKNIVDGKLQLTKGKIAKIDGNNLFLDSGEVTSAECIVFNTGYDKSAFGNFFFKEDFSNPRKLFKHCIHPDYGLRVSLVGWARPTQGGWPACSEMQARYISKLLSGEVQLKERTVMQEIIKQDLEYYKEYFSYSSHIESLINYPKFMQDLAELIGCNYNKIQWTDWKLSFKLFFGSHLSCFYRLNTPNYKTKARKIIKALPVAYSWRRIFILLLFNLRYNFLKK